MKPEYLEKLKVINNLERQNLIDLWISNERDRAILKRRLMDGIGYEPLAEEFNLSRSQVIRIVHKAEDRLFRHI